MSCALVNRLRVRLRALSARVSMELMVLALELATELSEATLDTEDVLESD